jgi:hypothetical protein
MDLSALTEHLDAVAGHGSLELPFGDRVYLVREPGTLRGVRLAIWLAAATLPQAERDKLRREQLGKDTLPVLALGADVAAQMDADDVPTSVKGILALVATIAFVQGQDAADRYVARLRADLGQGDASGEAPPSASPRRKRSGTSTASASKTPTRASGPTTASPSTSAP